MMRADLLTRVAGVGALLLALVDVTGCPIGINDPLQSFGAPCGFDEAACTEDLRCVQQSATDTRGKCAPVLDYGACKAPGYSGVLGSIVDVSVKAATTADLTTAHVQGARKLKDLRIANNRATADVDVCALAGVQRVENTLVIADSNATTLDGLQTLTSAGAGIAIVNNAQLTSLAALSSLVAVGTHTSSAIGAQDFQILIAANHALPASEVDALRARLPTSITVKSCGNEGGGADTGCTALAPTLTDLARESAK